LIPACLKIISRLVLTGESFNSIVMFDCANEQEQINNIESNVKNFFTF